MKTRIVLYGENDKPISVLGDNPQEKVKKVWDAVIALLAIHTDDIMRVESVEVWDSETDIPQTKAPKRMRTFSEGGIGYKPQTDWEKEKYEKSLCNSCEKNCDNRKRNLYMVECNKYEPQTESISLQGGEDVHNFCKCCEESRVRHFYGEPYIVCKQVDDVPSICLKKCPLSKWIAEDVYLITPQTEKTCNNCGRDKAMCLYCEERNEWIPQTERSINEN